MTKANMTPPHTKGDDGGRKYNKEGEKFNNSAIPNNPVIWI
jgi:hypothetical protein